MKRLTVDLPDETHKKFKIYCVDQNRDMSDVVREIVEEILQKAEKKKTKQERAYSWIAATGRP